MVQDVFKEKMEYLGARFKTKMGIFEWIFGTMIWGFIILTYVNEIKGFIVNNLNFLPSLIITPVSWLVFGIFSALLGLIITFILTRLYKYIFKKNGNIIK